MYMWIYIFDPGECRVFVGGVVVWWRGLWCVNVYFMCYVRMMVLWCVLCTMLLWCVVCYVAVVVIWCVMLP